VIEVLLGSVVAIGRYFTRVALSSSTELSPLISARRELLTCGAADITPPLKINYLAASDTLPTNA
jgi:hypothetical protein